MEFFFVALNSKTQTPHGQRTSKSARKDSGRVRKDEGRSSERIKRFILAKNQLSK